MATSTTRRTTFESVIKAVSTRYGVTLMAIRGPRKFHAIAHPRMVAMALTRELTGMSYPKIGSLFGGRDHTTVLHACRRIREMEAKDEETGAAMEALRKELAEVTCG